MPISILTATISIPFSRINKKNIDKLLLYKLKNMYEKKCCSHGYIKEDSIEIVQRSQGKIRNIDNISYISYEVNYKIDTFNPLKGDIIKCCVNNTTKMGTIGYYYEDDKNYVLKTSPMLIIIPLSDDTSNLNPDDKIDVEVLISKLKYNSEQIQVIGKLAE